MSSKKKQECQVTPPPNYLAYLAFLAFLLSWNAKYAKLPYYSYDILHIYIYTAMPQCQVLGMGGIRL